MVCFMVEIVIKNLDKLGRIVIPKKWREKIGDSVILIWEKPIIKIVPMRDFRLTDLFDSIEFSGNIEDWAYVKKLKRRLLDEISGL